MPTMSGAEGKRFIIKNVIPEEHEYQQELQKPLSSCPNLRTVADGFPGPEVSIYLFLETDFLINHGNEKKHAQKCSSRSRCPS